MTFSPLLNVTFQLRLHRLYIFLVNDFPFSQFIVYYLPVLIWSNYFSNILYLFIYSFILPEFPYFLLAFILVSVLDCPFLYLIRFSVYMLAAYISMFYVENRLLPLHFIIFIIRISWHIYLSMYEFFFILFLSLNSAFSSAFSFFLQRKVKLCSHPCLKIRHSKIVDIILTFDPRTIPFFGYLFNSTLFSNVHLFLQI